MAALLKPGAVGAAILTGGIIGEAGTQDWFIRVKRFRGRFHSPSIQTTGDGDANPRFENSLLLYLDFVLQGWMVAASPIGVINLVVAAKNPSTNAMTVKLSSSRSFVFKILIEDILLDWDMEAPVAGLVMRGKMTNTSAAAAFEI